MKHTTLTLLAAFLLVFAASVNAQDLGSGESSGESSGNGSGAGDCQFIDEDGDGFNDLAPDADGDGIPNGLDPDYVKPGDGSGEGEGEGIGNQYRWAYAYGELFRRVFGEDMVAGEGHYGPGDGSGESIGDGTGGGTFGPGAGSSGGVGEGTGSDDNSGVQDRRGGRR